MACEDCKGKEWAYAGFSFNLTGAAMSMPSGDPVGVVIVPLVLLVS
jgi:hypothetical protein